LGGGGRKGNCGSEARAARVGMLLRSAWRKSRSAAVVASVPSNTRSEPACGEG